MFYWKYLSDKFVDAVFVCFFCVSILVLLEVSFRHTHGKILQKGGESFNPCFIGSIFQTFSIAFLRKALFQFQSLFYWKYLSDTGFKVIRNFIDAMFQSLFYWKYLSDATLYNPRFPYCDVSILVLLEVSFRQDIFDYLEYEEVVFQSLFYWKYLSDIILTDGYLTLRKSFNPCFIGSIFQTAKT